MPCGDAVHTHSVGLVVGSSQEVCGDCTHVRGRCRSALSETPPLACLAEDGSQESVRRALLSSSAYPYAMALGRFVTSVGGRHTAQRRILPLMWGSIRGRAERLTPTTVRVSVRVSAACGRSAACAALRGESDGGSLEGGSGVAGGAGRIEVRPGQSAEGVGAGTGVCSVSTIELRARGEGCLHFTASLTTLKPPTRERLQLALAAAGLCSRA